MKHRLTAMFIISILGIVCFFNNSPALAQDAKAQFNTGLEATAKGTGHEGMEITSENLPETIGKIIKIVLSFLGVIFLILIIYGGFIWMMARGNEQQVTKAKGIIFNAIIGLIVVLAAYAITAYFGGEISNVVT